MRTLFLLGEKLGLWLSILSVVAFLACAGWIARTIPAILWQYPILAIIALIAVMLFAGFGGLVGFWIVADLIEYQWRGYRVRWMPENGWYYEERNSKGARQSLPFWCKALTEEYWPPYAVRLPNESVWDSEVPQWAKGRRVEIVERIAKCLSAGQGKLVQFLD